jgi:hypothetical protein
MVESCDGNASAAVRYVAHLVGAHAYDEAIRFLARHVVWRGRRRLLERAMALARADPPVTQAMPRWLDEEQVSGVLALSWRWMTSADPRWSAADDSLYRRGWAEAIVVGRAVSRAPPEHRLVEQTAIHDGIATRALNPALAPLLLIEYPDEVRAQLALRDCLLPRALAAG